jgi:hypothetical protein
VCQPRRPDRLTERACFVTSISGTANCRQAGGRDLDLRDDAVLALMSGEALRLKRGQGEKTRS